MLTMTMFAATMPLPRYVAQVDLKAAAWTVPNVAAV
jgi:hypothetical protein